MKRQTGFTLIEILVAVAIFGLLTVAAYTVLDSGVRSKQQSEARLEHLAQIQRLFYSLSNDLQYLAYRRVRDELGDYQPLMSGESDLSGLAFKLAFSRSNWRNPAGFKRSNLQFVDYRIEDNQVIRRHRVFLDKAPNSAEMDRTLADGINAISVRFLDANQQWQDQWGMFEEQQLSVPLAVVISIETDLYGEIERYFSIEKQGLEQ